MSDRIPKPVNESKEQPMKYIKDTDSAASGTIKEGNSKMVKMSGLPDKQDGDKMPHEHFHDKMNKALSGDCR